MRVRSARYWRHLQGMAVLGLAVTSLAPTVSAKVDELADSTELVGKLLEINMADYAQLQIELLRKDPQFSKRTEEIDLAEAELKIAQRKPKEAEDLLKKVPAASPNFLRALLQRADIADTPEAKLPVYDDFFKRVSKPTVEQAKMYREAVLRSARALLEAKGVKDNIKLGVARLNLLSNLPAEGGGMDAAQVNYTVAVTLLDAAESMADDELPPISANRIKADNSGVDKVSGYDLKAGDKVRVAPGETFPADGVLITGPTTVALAGGDGKPVEAKKDNPVVTGTKNVSAAVDMQVTSAPPSPQTIAAQAITKLTDLVWAQNYITSLAYVQKARALIISGKPAEAIKSLGEVGEFLLSWDKTCAETPRMGKNASPLAGTYYYLGEAITAQAAAITPKWKGEKDPKKKDELGAAALAKIETAAKQYAKVANEYSKSPYGPRALGKIAELDEAYVKVSGGKHVPGVKSVGAMPVLLQRAKEAYTQKDYPAAINAALAAVRLDTKSADAPEMLYLAVNAYLQQDKLLQATALADLMANTPRWQEEARTASALSVVSSRLAQAVKDAKTANNAASEASLRADMTYVNLALIRVKPDHPRAPRIALELAEARYKEALQLRKEWQELKDKNKPEEEQDAKQEAMKDALREAGTSYEAVVKTAGTSEQGYLATYNLGWVYMLLDDHQRAAETFLQFVEARGEPSTRRAQAKYYAAERLMRTDSVDDAITHFKEFIEWSKPGGPYAGDEKVSALRGDAQAFLPWCTDTRAKAVATKAKYFEDEVLVLQEKIANGSAQKEYDKAVANANAGGGDGPAPVIEKPAERLATLKTNATTYGTQAAQLRDEATQAFEDYLKDNASNEKHAPAAMAKLASLYRDRYLAAPDTNKKALDQASEWLTTLNKNFPSAPAGQQALFTLYRTLVDTGLKDKDIAEKAKKIAGELRSKLAGTPAVNVNYIASSLILEGGAKVPDKVIDADLSLAANAELVRRATDKKSPEAAALKSLLPLARYRTALTLIITGKPDEAIKAVDTAITEDSKSPYYYDLITVKAKALVKLNRQSEAANLLGTELATVGSEHQVEYLRLSVATMQIELTEPVTQENVTDALKRGFPIVRFTEATNDEVRPYLEAAYLHVFRALCMLGRADEARKYQEEYTDKFGDKGLYRKEIQEVVPSKNWKRN